MSLRNISFIFLVVLIWGLTFVVSKIGLEELPPLFLAFVRFFLTAIPAVLFCKFPRNQFFRVACYGLAMFAAQFGLFFIGMNLGVPAGLSSIIIQVHVFFSLLLAHFFFHEQFKGWQIAGAIVSFSGIAYAAFNVEESATLSLAGFFFIIGAALAWGGGSAISKTLKKIDILSLVSWGSMVAWPPLLIFSLFIEGPEYILSKVEHISWTSIFSVIYLTYIGTLIGFALWSWLLNHLPLSKVVPYTLLIPIVGMISSALILGERLQPWKIGASMLVIGGVCLDFFGPRLFSKKKPKEDST